MTYWFVLLSYLNPEFLSIANVKTCSIYIQVFVTIHGLAVRVFHALNFKGTQPLIYLYYRLGTHGSAIYIQLTLTK